MSFYIRQIVKLWKYMAAMSLFIFFSYFIYVIFDVDTIIRLGTEDGLFEYLTAIFFLTASIFFLTGFIKNRNLFFLLFFFVFFLGFGEEISWGQRLLNFTPPGSIEELNVQGEFNLHNIIIFNNEDYDENKKTGLSKLLTVNFLFKLFWLTYGILLPIAYRHIKWVSSLIDKIKLPVPPLIIGIFFIINWLTFRIILSFLLPPSMPDAYYWAVGEIRECGSSFIFMVIALYFLRSMNSGVAWSSASAGG